LMCMRSAFVPILGPRLAAAIGSDDRAASSIDGDGLRGSWLRNERSG
jgi:hypothetical protein